MTDDINRRQYPRVELDPPAMAYDDDGRELGEVHQTSGGGMRLRAKPEIVDEMYVGQQIRVTLIEPQSKTKNVVDVMIRHNDGEHVGLEFVSSRSVRSITNA